MRTRYFFVHTPIAEMRLGCGFFRKNRSEGARAGEKAKMSGRSLITPTMTPVSLRLGYRTTPALSTPFTTVLSLRYPPEKADASDELRDAQRDELATASVMILPLARVMSACGTFSKLII